MSPLGPVGSFVKHHYRHFNAAALVDAAEGYNLFLQSGGRMMVTLGGAMSTAELGLSLAEMIRRDMVHLITCTGCAGRPAGRPSHAENQRRMQTYGAKPKSCLDEVPLLALKCGSVPRASHCTAVNSWNSADARGGQCWRH